ncbi:MAG: hypothetical protein ABJH05_05185 [Fulvivirga sp.]
MAHTIKLIQYFLFSILLFGSVSAQNLTADTDPQSTTFGEFYVSLESELISKLREKGDDVDFSTFFYITIDGANKILGSYTLQGDTIVFKPRFLPDVNLVHHAYLNMDFLYKAVGLSLPDSMQRQVSRNFNFKSYDKIKYASIAGISPKINSYPANVLRLYLYFDQPMSFQNPYDYISLVNRQGETISEPFVIIPEGLWDESKTRLTLFIHPGRIKRNVGPNSMIGPVFEAGNTYTLKVDSTWKSASNKALDSQFQYTFDIGLAVRAPIKPEFWTVISPKAESVDPLLLKVNEYLDPVLLPKMLSIYSEEGLVVTGNWGLKNGNCQFKPASHWEKGNYTIKINPKLEDVCGNTVLSAFDRESNQNTVENPMLELFFEVK